jgi:hypothetical protein
VDRFKGVNFSSYIEDGTVIGHYLIDEPHDATNWNGTTVSAATLEEMARYSKQHWPQLATVVRSEPSQIGLSNRFRYLDAAWAQFVHRKGPAEEFIRKNLADAQRMGLGLVVGLNLLKGGPGGDRLTASQIEDWGSALLESSYPCAFISWVYDRAYLERADIKAAMSRLSQKAQNIPARSCDGRATDSPPPPPPPISLPGVKGILLKVERLVEGRFQYLRLTWSGAAGARVNLYRNGILVRTPVNDGKADTGRWRIGVSRSLKLKLCETRSSRCSNVVTATLR